LQPEHRPTPVSKMSQKNRNLGGKPKGLPKSGGRQKGTPNKSKGTRLRELFSDRGFDFVDEFIKAYRTGDQARLYVLGKMAPYFMQRLRQEAEAMGTPADDIPSEDEISTADLLKLVGK
jgi:hypothetical protein